MMNDTVVKEFYRLLHRIHQCRPDVNRHSELANVEFFMLMQISILMEQGMEEITLGDIIKCTDMTMSAASKKITILEKKGYVSRSISKRDKRNVNIMLTDKGKKICDEDKRKKHEWVTKVLSKMGEEDSRKMFELVNRLFDIIEEE
mgnify:CR=1 FL=1